MLNVISKLKSKNEPMPSDNALPNNAPNNAPFTPLPANLLSKSIPSIAHMAKMPLSTNPNIKPSNTLTP